MRVIAKLLVVLIALNMPTSIVFGSTTNANDDVNSQQQISITGTVVDESGEPIPGVTVSVVGATIGVLTGFDGEYAINVPSSSTVLRFSFIGYVAQEITVNNQREIITLVEESHLLDEVVVIGFGVQHRSILVQSHKLRLQTLKIGYYDS